MPRSVKLPVPRPTYESMLKQLRIPKARKEELLAIIREPETHAQAPFSNSTLDELRLTGREKQVLALVLEVCPNREIAHRLGVHESTVRAHIGRLLRKTASSKSNWAAPKETHESAGATR